MNENIFENAKFGDKYILKDGTEAIYLGKEKESYTLAWEEDGSLYEELYYSNGAHHYDSDVDIAYKCDDNDIRQISYTCQEYLKKEIDNLNECNTDIHIVNMVIDAFKKGYNMGYTNAKK